MKVVKIANFGRARAVHIHTSVRGIMPRLKTDSPPQHGKRTGTAGGKRGPAEPLPRSKKAPRTRVVEGRHRDNTYKIPHSKIE